MKTMSDAVSWFEIPATNIQRAKAFYQDIFDMELQELDLGDGFKMALFPVETGGVGGALCQHEEFYRPGHAGPLIYLNGNPDLQAVLDRVQPSGGKVIKAKTQISEEYGYMAVFEDTEGNRIALHSGA
jgi:predicted enzyme related to lactoylglutathione lyase